MYLQLTSRCQMNCEHCCFSCKKRGRDMTMETVENSLQVYRDMCRESGSVTLTLGGGEPTLHPRFFEILEKYIVASAMYTDDDNYRPYIVSNGFDLQIAKKLIRLADRNLIGLRFSIDNFHVQLDHEDELMAWNTRNNRYYSTELLNVTQHGRAKKSGIWTYNGCCCDTLFVKPSGNMYFCGCLTKKLGNINSSYHIPEYYFDMESHTEACSKKIRKFLVERKDQ